MNNTVNLALQILPMGKAQEETYALIDEAIKVIQRSGLRHEVCPYETVIEGSYEQVMQVAAEAQEVCLREGAESLLVYCKIRRKKNQPVSIEDSMAKYR